MRPTLAVIPAKRSEASASRDPGDWALLMVSARSPGSRIAATPRCWRSGLR